MTLRQERAKALRDAFLEKGIRLQHQKQGIVDAIMRVLNIEFPDYDDKELKYILRRTMSNRAHYRKRKAAGKVTSKAKKPQDNGRAQTAQKPAPQPTQKPARVPLQEQLNKSAAASSCPGPQPVACSQATNISLDDQLLDVMIGKARRTGDKENDQSFSQVHMWLSRVWFDEALLGNANLPIKTNSWTKIKDVEIGSRIAWPEAYIAPVDMVRHKACDGQGCAVCENGFCSEAKVVQKVGPRARRPVTRMNV
eukprot:jgi/Chlat1/343/Chrsp10S01519